MIWNNKQKASANQTAAKQKAQSVITADTRLDLIQLVRETIDGTSAPIGCRRNGMLCSVGEDLKRPITQARFDRYGRVRDLAITEFGSSLYSKPYLASEFAYADDYLREPAVVKAFRLEKADLTFDGHTDFPFGTRIMYKQLLTATDENGQVVQYPVRGGAMQLFIRDGRLTYVGSTIRHGNNSTKLGKVVSEAQAIDLAKSFEAMPDARVVSCQMQFSAHKNQFSPVYAVKITNISQTPADVDEFPADTTVIEPKFVEVLVDARAGKAVHSESKLRHGPLAAKGQPAKTNPLADVFLREPDYRVDIAKQIFAQPLADMPDPTVLKDAVFKMFVLEGNRWVLVKPNADGNFQFPEGSSKFSAGVSFFALHEMRKCFERLGFHVVLTPVPVRVDDPQTPDNASMLPDLNSPEMRIGLGSGVQNGGLVKNIAYSIFVLFHELGHWLITIQTPGNDLPGTEGGGGHEGIADIMAWLMNWLCVIKFATVLGVTVTRKDIANDLRKIGEYCLPPNGIRQQKNKMTTKDQTGEPHNDGEIIGGALSDFFADYIVNSPGDLKDAIENCIRMLAQTLAMVPVHRVLFTDILRALISADLNMSKGANRAAIEKAFKAHGIALSGKTKPTKKKHPTKKHPTPTGKGKGKGKGKTKTRQKPTPKKAA